MKITGWVGSMSCAWIFCLLSVASLPAVLTQAFHLHVFPSWLISVGLIALVAWIAQTFLQLVLLSIILVGTNVSAEASDARAAKQFEDTRSVTIALDRLDETHRRRHQGRPRRRERPHRAGGGPADAGRPHGEQPHRSPGQAASDSRAGGTAPAGQAEPGATQGRRRMSIVMYDAIDLSQIPADAAAAAGYVDGLLADVRPAPRPVPPRPPAVHRGHRRSRRGMPRHRNR